jgi:hypothetical protein
MAQSRPQRQVLSVKRKALSMPSIGMLGVTKFHTGAVGIAYEF